MGKGTEASHQEIGDSRIRIVAGKAVSTVLEKVVVVVEASLLVRSAESDVMAALDQANRVVPVKGCTCEDGIGEGAKPKEPGDAKGLDGFIRRLI